MMWCYWTLISLVALAAGYFTIGLATALDFKYQGGKAGRWVRVGPGLLVFGLVLLLGRVFLHALSR